MIPWGRTYSLAVVSGGALVISLAALVLAWKGASDGDTNQKKTSETEVGSYERVAVADTLDVISKSRAFQNLNKVFSEVIDADKIYFLKYEKQLRHEEARFHQLKNKINHAKTSREEKIRLADSLLEETKNHESKVRELQDLVSKRKDYLDKVFSKARSFLYGRLLESIKKVALDRRMSIVVQMPQVLYQSEDRDLTADVLAHLNQETPEVVIHIESLDTIKRSIGRREVQ